MDEKSLTQILAEGENQHQAFVVDLADRWNTAVLISSFANAKGGSVWIGVKPTGKIMGVYAEAIQKELSEIVERFFINPFVINSKVWKNKVHFVVQIIVESAKEEAVYLKNDRQQTVLFERHGTKCVQASKIALKNLQFKSQDKVLSDELSAKEDELLAFIKKSEQLSLSQMYKFTNFEMSEIDLLVSQLVYRGLVAMDFSTDVTLYRFKSK